MRQDRKTDRRTLYTINAIKDAFIDLEKEMNYEKISVKKLCERADISRATFYLHYDGIDDVLNEVIDDALLFSEQASGNVLDLIEIIQSGRIQDVQTNEAILPACQRMADSDKYHNLFMDSSLSEYIISRITQHEKQRIVPVLMQKTGLDEEYAELVFRFMLHGTFSVNKSLKWEKNAKWFEMQKIISTFMEAGMKELSRM